jgi:hypothetical protein
MIKNKLVSGLLSLALTVGLSTIASAQKEPRQSPAAVVNYANKGLEITIKYGRPYKKGRVIFGSDPNALLPYGKYWRLGANEATLIQINKDVLFDGKDLKAGNYSMYAYPGKDTWIIYLNSDVKHWGAQEPDHNLDVLKTEVKAITKSSATEQLTIGFDKAQENGKTFINIDWDKTEVKISVVPK